MDSHVYYHTHQSYVSILSTVLHRIHRIVLWTPVCTTTHINPMCPSYPTVLHRIHRIVLWTPVCTTTWDNKFFIHLPIHKGGPSNPILYCKIGNELENFYTDILTVPTIRRGRVSVRDWHPHLARYPAHTRLIGYNNSSFVCCSSMQ